MRNPEPARMDSSQADNHDNLYRKMVNFNPIE